MKHAISYLLQNAGQRLAFCLLAVTMCAIPAIAQDDDEEVETTIKQPKRTEKAVQYETWPQRNLWQVCNYKHSVISVTRL